MLITLTGDKVWLRPIAQSDVNDRYLSWFSGEQARFIEFSSGNLTIERLHEYVRGKIDDPKVVMFAIFEITSDLHIGNLKLEPFGPTAKDCDLGVFIGDKDFLGKGFGFDAIKTTVEFLASFTAVEIVTLGVDNRNLRAIKAYIKIGFESVGEPELVVAIDGDRYFEQKMRLHLDRS